MDKAQHSSQSNELTCAKLLEEFMPLVIGRLYVPMYFNHFLRDEVKEMIERIRSEIRHQLQTTDVFDDEKSRLASLEKVD